MVATFASSFSASAEQISFQYLPLAIQLDSYPMYLLSKAHQLVIIFLKRLKREQEKTELIVWLILIDNLSAHPHKIKQMRLQKPQFAVLTTQTTFQ